MGFFIGFKFFEEKDRYSFEATQERERERREKQIKAEREKKREQIKKKKAKEKKERLQTEWNAEAAKYHEEQFGFDANPYKTGYINDDAESYKEQIAAQYGGSGAFKGAGAQGLNRGAGVRSSQQMKKLDGNSPFDPKNKMPAGMNMPGLPPKEAEQDSGSVFNRGNQGGASGGNASKKGKQGTFTGKLSRPL